MGAAQLLSWLLSLQAVAIMPKTLEESNRSLAQSGTGVNWEPTPVSASLGCQPEQNQFVRHCCRLWSQLV